MKLEISMKEIGRNKWLFASLVVGLLCVLTLTTALNPSVAEAFVPRIVREQYRPLERKVRTTCEGMVARVNAQLGNLLRRANLV